MFKRIIAIVSFLTLTFTVAAQMADTARYGLLKIREELGFYDRALDTLMTETSSKAYENFLNEFIDIDLEGLSVESTPDAVYDKRLKMLATEVQLPYNEIVKKYINTYTRRSSLMENILGRGRFYFPYIEDCLFRYNLPMELKMLPVIESAMIPTARSRAGAVGIWQFMTSTAKAYGLEVNSFVDERADVEKSTDAACRYLRDMYRIYGDWTLVIASYNCGSGNVNKAMRRSRNAHDYWEIWSYLPRETRNYVPAFIAATYAYTFYRSYDLNPAEPPVPLAVDTVMVDHMMHFEQISSTIDVPLEVLRALNPQYVRDVIPASSKTYKLTLPQKNMGEFLDSLGTIYAKDTIYLSKYLANNNLTKAQVTNPSSIKARVVYKVRSGDTLSRIASKYHVTVKQIQKWNNMKNTKLRIGQKLLIY